MPGGEGSASNREGSVPEGKESPTERDDSVPGGDARGGPFVPVDDLPAVPGPDPDLGADWWDREAMREGSLVHPIRHGEMLLIHKKRGVGAGNLIGPGGKHEGTETLAETGIREVREETGLRVHDVEKVGELEFVFGEDPFMLVNVFVTTEFSGTPEESEEGIPGWYDLDDLPYDRMWEDDRYWVPYMLAREQFVARFRFDADGDEILAGDVETRVEF